MGTNYYWHEEPPCPHCGRNDEGRHIGKSSAGWCFSLHVYPDEGICNIYDWQKLFDWGGYIDNEYGHEVSLQEMKCIITKREFSRAPSDNFDYERNQAIPGPNNLVRHKVDGVHCIGNGDGTFDYIIGDFC
jgi:hypothetical protein